MADNKAPKNVGKGTTPVGIAVFPYLTAPDMKFAKNGHGSYKVTLKLPREGNDEFFSKLEEMHEKALEAIKAELAEKNEKLPGSKKVAIAKLIVGETHMKPEVDDEGNETGMVLVNFKCPGSYTDKKTEAHRKVKLPLFDAKGKDFPAGVVVWGGSKLRVAFEGRPYFTAASKMIGLTLRMTAVKVIKVSNGSAKDAAAFKAIVDGKPVANQYVQYGGRTAAGGRIEMKAVRTNAEGIGEIKLTPAGTWYVKFINMARLSGDAEADYESKWASLTFAVR